MENIIRKDFKNMEKLNRTCIICGKRYSHCNNCQRDAGKPTWYFIFDGQNCHDIYEVCTQYRDGEIDAKKAYELISKLDLSNIEDFVEVTKNQIKEIIRLNEETTNVKESVEKAEVKNETVKVANKKK